MYFHINVWHKRVRAYPRLHVKEAHGRMGRALSYYTAFVLLL